jgi:tetratricopeptide (TPR) repeat protein
LWPFLAEANLGQALAAEGQPIEARQAMERSLRTFSQINAQGFKADVQVRLAEVLVLEGRTEKAGELAREALETARWLHSQPLEAMAMRLLGRLARAVGDRESARVSLEAGRQAEAWNRLLAEKKSELTRLVEEDALAGKRSGRHLRINNGSFYDWLGEPVPVCLGWGKGYDVLPDDQADRVEWLRQRWLGEDT